MQIITTRVKTLKTMRAQRENKVLENLETTWMISIIDEEPRKLRREGSSNAIDVIKLILVTLLCILTINSNTRQEKNLIFPAKLAEDEEDQGKM